jgi:hypothetical protein
MAGFKFSGLLSIPSDKPFIRPCGRPLGPFAKTLTMPIRLFLIAALLLLSGCASVINGSKQSVHVRTLCGANQVPSACVAENPRGRQSFVTPAQIWVDRDLRGLRISCRDERYQNSAVWVQAVPDMALAGNVLLGGLVGASVDVANGRGVAFPSQINIQSPHCSASRY